ncbi:MAG: FeoB small GTPase domain-containing protein, partial [Gemmataceae bacterium]
MNTACEQLRAVLVGNPNTGKSTLFNGLSGLRQHVGNYPGVTIETKKGHFRHEAFEIELVDLPGTYSLAPRSPDELAAVEIVLGQRDGELPPNVIISIVDASNLERNLFLTTQVLELGSPVVVALNMMDVAEAQGLVIDVPRLEEQLGVRVVAIQANKKKGLDDLKNAIVAVAKKHVPPACPAFPEAFETEVSGLQAKMGDKETAFFARRLLLDSAGGHAEARLAERHGDGLVDAVRAARKRLIDAGLALLALEAKTRYGWIRGKVNECLKRPAERPVTWTDRIDRVLTHRVWGTLFFLGVMFFVFVSIFFFAAPLMDLIDAAKGALGDWVGGLMAAGPLKSLVVDGIIEGVGGVVIFLPQILILFIFVAVLEDSGYMARAAFLMDRL